MLRVDAEPILTFLQLEGTPREEIFVRFGEVALESGLFARIDM